MQLTDRFPLRRTAVLAAVFGAGLVAGALQSPLAARAQSGGVGARATLSFVPVSAMLTTFEIRQQCTDVTVVHARGQGRTHNEEGVIVLCER